MFLKVLQERKHNEEEAEAEKKKEDNSHGSVLGDVAGNTTNESANGLMPQHKT